MHARASRSGRATIRRCPASPTSSSAPTARAVPHWERLLLSLAELEPDEIVQRFAAADRRIRNRGMSYRVQGETAERTWPLSRMPLLIPESEWREIERGMIQRAELLDRTLADIYGEGRLVAEGLLPAAAVAGSRDFVAAMRGVVPPGKRWLRLYAVDIGRGPDGRWWALGDRGQAPSGSGYALENRLVVSQAFSSLYSRMNVERLAPFFRDLRAGLRAAGERSEPRIGILTPGPLSATYTEQAYLARYLGFLMVEGDDLVVRDGRAFVRTIAGLKRCDVLWRHVDARMDRPARAERCFAHRRAGSDRRHSRRRRCGRKHAGLGPRRIARPARLPAHPRPAPARRRPHHAQHRHLVVRSARGARAGAEPARLGRRSPAPFPTSFPACRAGWRSPAPSWALPTAPRCAKRSRRAASISSART